VSLRGQSLPLFSQEQSQSHWIWEAPRQWKYWILVTTRGLCDLSLVTLEPKTLQAMRSIPDSAWGTLAGNSHRLAGYVSLPPDLFWPILWVPF
jgi:hypothetical protein